MPNRRNPNQKAFVDPLSLIAVFLLVVTLAVTTVTVNDPLKKQLISSYAKEKGNFQSYADSLIRQRERSGKCKGSGCVAEEVINNQTTQGKKSTAAQSAQTEAEQKIIDMYNKAKAGDLNALNDLKKSNSSLGEQVQKELDAKAAAAPKTEGGKSPTNLTLNQLVGNSDDENAFVSKESQAAQKQATSYLNNKITKLESETQNAKVKSDALKNTTATIAAVKPKYESQTDCEKNTNPYSPEFKSCNKYASSEENKGNVWDNLVGLSSIFKGVIDTPSTNSVNNQNSLSSLQLNTSGVTLPTTSGSTNVYVPKYSSKLECEQNTQKGSREQKACGQFATSNENIKTIFNTLDTVTFGTFSDYAESYAPQDVKISWKTAGYESLKSCQQDMLDKYHNPNAAASCNTYQITKDQLSSSVKLGTVITAEGALAVTGAGYGSGAITGAQALTNGLAISTVYQTGNAGSTCIDNPGSQECKDEAKYAALSWANVFTAAGLAGATQNTVQAWRYANAAVNAVNVAADVKDTINSCTGENASGLGCTISSVATLLDVGGGALDIVEIAKDFNFSGLSGDIGGWPVDAFPAKANTITDVIPTGTTITDITESIAPTNAYTDFTNIDNIMADITLSQVVDTPDAESIVNITHSSPDEIAANLTADPSLYTSTSSYQETVYQPIKDAQEKIKDVFSAAVPEPKKIDILEVQDEIEQAKKQAQEIINDPSFLRVKEKAEKFKTANTSEKAILSEQEKKLIEIRNEYITATADEMTVQQRNWGKASRDARANGLPTPRLQYNKLTEVVMSIPNESASFNIEAITRAAERYDYPGSLDEIRTFLESKGGTASRRDIIEFTADVELGKNPLAEIPSPETPIAVFTTNPVVSWIDQNIFQPVSNYVTGQNLLFGDTAMMASGGGVYKSLGGQKLIINPSTDPKLQYYLQNARLYLGENRTSENVSRVNILNEYVHSSLRYADPDLPYYASTQLRESLYSNGTAKLGDFTDLKTGVCREFAACLHVALADNGKQSYMAIGDVDSVEGLSANQEGGRHAWVEFLDSKTGAWMVADPTVGFVLPLDEAYQQKYVNVKNVERQVFVWPEGTPLWTRITKKITQ